MQLVIYFKSKSKLKKEHKNEIEELQYQLVNTVNV